MSFISKIMKDKYPFDFQGHSEFIWLVLFLSAHYLEKWELNIPAFCLKSIINLFSWKGSGVTGIFLLKIFSIWISTF